MSRITLEAINDPEVRVSGEVIDEYVYAWEIQLSPHVTANLFEKDEWRIAPPPLPTALGTVFRATVSEKPNVRVVVADDDSIPYFQISDKSSGRWIISEEIDPGTVVIELEGVSDER